MSLFSPHSSLRPRALSITASEEPGTGQPSADVIPLYPAGAGGGGRDEPPSGPHGDFHLSPPHNSKPRDVLRFLIGAVGAVVFASPLWIPFLFQHVAASQYSTDIGQRRVIRLSDGSYLTLNTNTRISIWRNGQTIRVDLRKGEVLCDLHDNPARHFVVFAAGVRVTDTGTIFSVRLTGTGATVTVEQGQVKISGPGFPVTTVLESQRAHVDPRDHHALIDNVPSEDVQREFLWQYGRIQFVREKLALAVAEINRYNKTQIEIMDERTANLKLTTTLLDPTDPADFAKRVEHTGNVKWGLRQRPDGTTVLTLRQATPAP